MKDTYCSNGEATNRVLDRLRAVTEHLTALCFSGYAKLHSNRMLKKLSDIAPLLAFAIALIAMLGSLYAQYIGYEPCVLCWWQRIFMYPLVILIPVGVWRGDRGISSYVLPFVGLGALTALYQTLLYYGILSETLAPCSVGVSCTQSLPSLIGLNLITASLLAFIMIGVLMLTHRRSPYENN